MDSQERTKKLSDGSLLKWKRPGNFVLETIQQVTQQLAAERNAERASQNSMTPEQFAAVGRAHMEAAADERKRIRELPVEDRRKARVESLLASLAHRVVVSKCALSWSAVKSVAEEGLREVASDLLEEAAEAILHSHFERASDHEGNSKTTSAN